jgi:hypothetical protein
MSNDDARTFLESVTGFIDDPERDGLKSAQRPVKLGTIDALYNGTGNPKVLFDGETLMGVRTYAWVGRKPRANNRVVLVPQGHTYVILGTINDTIAYFLSATPPLSLSAAGVLSINAATETDAGISERATTSEGTAGADTSRYVSPAVAKAIKDYVAVFSVIGGNAQNVSNNTPTRVQAAWGTPEISKNVGSWSSGGLTITRPGDYFVNAGVGFNSATAYRTIVEVLLNSTVWDTGVLVRGNPFGRNGGVAGGRMVTLAANDVLRVYVNQESGGTRAIEQNPLTFFSVHSVGAI